MKYQSPYKEGLDYLSSLYHPPSFYILAYLRFFLYSILSCPNTLNKNPGKYLTRPCIQSLTIKYKRVKVSPHDKALSHKTSSDLCLMIIHHQTSSFWRETTKIHQKSFLRIAASKKSSCSRSKWWSGHTIILSNIQHIFDDVLYQNVLKSRHWFTRYGLTRVMKLYQSRLLE